MGSFSQERRGSISARCYGGPGALGRRRERPPATFPLWFLGRSYNLLVSAFICRKDSNLCILTKILDDSFKLHSFRAVCWVLRQDKRLTRHRRLSTRSSKRASLRHEPEHLWGLEGEGEEGQGQRDVGSFSPVISVYPGCNSARQAWH